MLVERLGVGELVGPAGVGRLLLADELDLDGDGDALEWLPVDLAGAARVVDDPGTVDSGVSGGAGSIVDRGALERQ